MMVEMEIWIASNRCRSYFIYGAGKGEEDLEFKVCSYHLKKRLKKQKRKDG
jgi:hypothetical protein